MIKSALILALPIFFLLVAGCAGPGAPLSDNATSPPANNSTAPPANNTAGIPNPASLFCLERNGTLEMRTAAGGGQYGVCSFANGARCEEWAYYRGECTPEEPNFCQADSDCACGVHVSTRDCFLGQKEFVDETEQCPDFCTGIAAHLETKCVSNRCKSQMKDWCTNFGVDTCPADCVVCPPCEVCSSISCQSEEFCESIGFGRDWYNTTVNPK
ncbi:DUF333 domain-containing protein [Candidatus Micrarchaeota archaeon]|nr:DUF333 domain-containing protein [Candidatus Micrarchaeota archaeon]